MKAVYLTGLREVEIREAPEPELTGPDDVIVRVDVVGVCGSDMHYYRTGRIGCQVVEYPWIVGHECAGTVVQAGPEAHLAVGTRVAVDPLINCRTCDQCTSGRIHTCRDQAFLGCPGQAPGALAERIVMPAHACFPVPDELTILQAALVEPFSIAVWAQRLAGDPTGKRIGILGAGPIGLSVLTALKAAGDCTVYMTEKLDYRIELARKMGADWVGDAGSGDMVPQIASAEPLGLDWVFECAGEQETIDEGVEMLAPGGTLLIVGIPESDRVSFEMNHMRRKELVIQNVRRQNDCVQPAIDLVAVGKVDLDPMVSHEFAMADTQKAFDIVADYRDGAVKAMIHVP